MYADYFKYLIKHGVLLEIILTFLTGFDKVNTFCRMM